MRVMKQNVPVSHVGFENIDHRLLAIAKVDQSQLETSRVANYAEFLAFPTEFQQSSSY